MYESNKLIAQENIIIEYNYFNSTRRKSELYIYIIFTDVQF